jgi:hypothetical protein
MSDVSTLRIRLESGMANQVERLCTRPIGPARRELRACGELLSMPLVRAEGADEQYDLVTR